MMSGPNYSPHCVVSDHEVKRNEGIIKYGYEVVHLAIAGSRVKKPITIAMRRLTEPEVLALGAGTYDFIGNDGKLRSIRITSVKRWKREPKRIEIHVKYGMYEFATWDLAEAMQRLVVRVEP
jgi:hypothetical protein